MGQPNDKRKSPVSRPPHAGRTTRLRSMRRGDSSTTAMKSRPLQRKAVQKRTLATVKTVKPPDKRQRIQQEPIVSPRTAREERAEQSDVENPTRNRRDEQSLCIRLENEARNARTTEHDQPRFDASPTREVDDEPHVIASVRPGTRNDSISSPPSSAMLSREQMTDILKTTEQRILRHVVSQQRGVIERMEGLESLVKENGMTSSALKSSIEDLKVMVLPGTNHSTKTASQRNSTRARNKSKSLTLQNEVVRANPTLLAELKIIFQTDISSMAAAKTIAATMLKYHRNRESTSISSRAMNVFLYSFKGKGAVLKEGIGFRHGEFRHKLAKTMVELGKCLPDHIFATKSMSNSSEEREESSNSLTRKPSWLTSDLVDGAALSLARKNHECFVSELPKDPSTPDKRKALFIAKSFFKVVVDMLRQSRDKSRIRMFEDGTYCLMDWEELKWFPPDLSNPTISFLWPEEDVVPPLIIPETSVGDLDNVRQINSELLQDLISCRKEMLLEVTYNVIVSKETTVKARREDRNRKIKILRRIINILRVSKSFLCGFCHLTEEDLLRAHPAMLQCLYRVAMVLREFFIDRISKSTNIRSSTQPAERIDMEQTIVTGDTPSSASRLRSTVPTEGMNDNDQRLIMIEGEGNRAGAMPSSEARDRDRQQESLGIRQSGNVERDTAAQRKQTPPIALSSLFPSDSERDRIIENYINLSFEAYDRIHFAVASDNYQGEKDRLEDGMSEAGDNDGELDSEEDNMSDIED